MIHERFSPPLEGDPFAAATIRDRGSRQIKRYITPKMFRPDRFRANVVVLTRDTLAGHQDPLGDREELADGP